MLKKVRIYKQNSIFLQLHAIVMEKKKQKTKLSFNQLYDLNINNYYLKFRSFLILINVCIHKDFFFKYIFLAYCKSTKCCTAKVRQQFRIYNGDDNDSKVQKCKTKHF